MRFLRITAAHAFLTGCAVAAIGTAGIARAADTPAAATPPQAAPDSGVGEIIVTAQKRSESAQNVPVAITSLNPLALANSGVMDTGDLKMVTPGLTFNTNLGGFGQPRIRGIGSTATGPGIENPVATVIDGVYLGSSNGAIMGLSDVQQVDILKGPQGTLFGRNATGGVIQVTSLDPTQALHANVTGTYGNYDTWGGTGYVTGGLTQNLSASVAGSYTQQDKGYGINVANGQQVGKSNTGAVRAKLLWTPDSDTRITLSGDFSDLQGSMPAIRTTSTLVTGGQTGGGPYDIDVDTQPYLHTQVGGGSLTVKRNLGSVELTSISAYRSSFLHTTIDGDQTEAPLLAVDIVQKEHQFSQELQLASTGRGPLRWVAGLYYFHYDGYFDPSTIGGEALAGGNVSYYDKATLNSYAAYGQATYAFDPATNLTVGLRYTLDQRTLYQDEATNNVYGYTGDATEYASKDFPKLTWRIALDHRFSRQLMAYVSYNRGFKSGTFQAQTTPLQPLQVETVDAFEGGFKADLLDRKLRLNLSGFYYDYTNLQANQIVNGAVQVYDAPGSINYGLDADLIFKPVRNLQFTGGISWLHARYKDGFTDAIFNANPGVNTAGITIVTGNASGYRLQDTPDFTANAGVSYDIDTAHNGNFRAAVNYYYNGGYYGDVQNLLKQNAYGLLDASLSWEAPGGAFSVKVWGKNLTNTYYFQQYDMTNYGNNLVAAPPRTYGVTLGAKY
jgi:iron complex outermembrane recepter protein